MSGKKGHYSFFQHTSCEYFPCHKGVKEADFNCLFCYCPLYALGKKCGGAFIYNEKGIKDCSGCSLPHRRDYFDRILEKYQAILDVIRRQDEECNTSCPPAAKDR